jgi:hypothetical protein
VVLKHSPDMLDRAFLNALVSHDSVQKAQIERRERNDNRRLRYDGLIE